MTHKFSQPRKIALSAAIAYGFLSIGFPAQAQNAPEAEAQPGGIPVITVTSQRTEQAIQSVPIAVTAVDSAAMERQQIGNFSDLQFNVPNVTFSKSNFTATNFQIRGVGNTVISSSSDNGVSIHINDVAVNSARLFEREYYDVERIEILRGPQGTLFGRNATSGVVNMITKRPELDTLAGSGEFEYGNYDTVRFEAMLNVPLGEKVAVRLAGNVSKRDGYTENLYDGSDIDGRDSYSFRASVLLEPSDNTSINLMVSWMEEDSNRTRSQKQMCHRDPTGVLGCLPDSLAFEAVNTNASMLGLAVSDLALGPYGLAPFPYTQDTSSLNPADMRKVNQDFNPQYRSDELLITLNIEQQLGDNYTLSFAGGYQDTSVWSQGDFGHDVTADMTIPQAVYDDFPIVANTMFPNGLFPTSAIEPSGTGVIGGHIAGFDSQLGGYDQSDEEAEQWSAELRLNSHYDGPINFMAGFFYLNYTNSSNYYIVSAALDYLALLAVPYACGSYCDGLAQSTSMFNNVVDPYKLESWAIFGEVYYDISDTVRLTGGLRYTDDTKTVTDLQYPLFGGEVVPLGTQEIFLGTPRTQTRSWGELTGRAVLEWSPDLDSFDASMFYLSYARGYKGGGINPPLVGVESAEFGPEFIDAYELGAKLNFADNRAQANVTAFYYDYQGLQVSKIINRTSINENIDAKIWGMEGEFLYAPNQNWMFNMSASYLNTNVGDARSVDPRDPTNGAPNTTLMKDLGSAANCVIHHNNSPDPTLDPNLAALFPAGAFPVPGLASKGTFGSCDATAGALAGYNQLAATDYTVDDGVEADLKGNELQQAPDFTINIGAQYTHFFGNGMSLSLRADYYYQSNMFGRMFNKDIDRIDSWDQLNTQIKLESANGSWYASAYVKNVLGDDNITGMYVSDPATGLFTNVFVLEPRRYGIIVGAQF